MPGVGKANCEGGANLGKRKDDVEELSILQRVDAKLITQAKAPEVQLVPGRCGRETREV